MDILQNVLVLETKFPDRYTRDITALVCNIVCNLGRVKDKSIREEFYKHPIWELAYLHIYNGSPLLEFIPAF